MYILMTLHKSVLIKIVGLPLDGRLPCYCSVRDPTCLRRDPVARGIGKDLGPIMVQSRHDAITTYSETSFRNFPKLDSSSTRLNHLLSKCCLLEIIL
jgi:hypothetical protein